jgi:hypothetical protein
MYIFYKRGLKSSFLTILPNLFIMSLIGIIIIGTVLPFNSAARERLETNEADVSAILPQGSMNDLSYETIDTTLSSIFLEESECGYAVNIPLIYRGSEGNTTITYIGISNGLCEQFQLDQNDIVSSPELSIGQMNITTEGSNQNFTLGINRIQDFSYEQNTFNQLLYHIYNSYQPILYSPIIVGNISLGKMIFESLEITSASLLAGVLAFFNEGWTKGLSFDELDQFIQNQEKQIFQHLVTEGIQPDLIGFMSYAGGVLYSLSNEIGDVTLLIQSLSIPNFVIALILIFVLQIGAYKLIRKDGKTLWSRGISSFKLKILYWSLELVIDLLGLLLAQTIFSTIILVSGLQNYLHSYFFVTFSLLTVVFILTKIYRFLRIEREVFTFGHAEERDEVKIMSTKRRVRGTLFRNLTYGFLISVILLQIFRIFEPLFWYPIFSGTLGVISDWFTYLTLVAVFGYLVFSISIFTVNLDQTKNVANMIRRIFKSGLKKLRVQRVASVAIFSLIVFLLIFEASLNNYDENRFVNENQLSDIIFSDKIFYGFDFNNVTNLSENIPEIKELYPFQRGQCSIISNGEIINGQVTVVNGSKHINQDLGWNHVVGVMNPQELNNILANFSQNSIIINQKAAELSGFRVGDSISIVIGIDYLYSNHLSAEIENMTIEAIVDTLPFTSGYNLNHLHVYIDLSHVLDILENRAINKFISSFGVDLVFNETATNNEKQLMVEQTIPKILFELGMSSLNMFIDSKYASAENQQFPAISMFITFNTVFAILFLPLFVIVFSRSAVKSVTPSIKQLITRGYSAKKLRNIYSKEIYLSLLSSIMIGVGLGLGLALTVIKSMNPWMLLATDTHFQLSIGLRLIAIILGGLLSSLAVIPFVVRPLNNVLEKYKKEKVKYETD